MSDTILDEVREILQKSPTTSFGQGYVIGLVAELEATQSVLSRVQEARADDIARADKAEAEVARLKLKCGEAAPEETEIFHVFGSEMVICPSCGEEIEEPWDEPGTDSDDDGNWHGVIECRGCDSKVEVHSQLIHFWTAKLVDAEAASRAVADSEVEG